jgi:O-antigen ligase
LTADGFELPKLAALVALLTVMVGAWALDSLRTGEPIRFAREYWFVIVLLVLAVVATIVAPMPWTALLGGPDRQGLLTMVVLALLTFMAMQLVTRGSRMRALAAAATVGGTVVALLALAQVTGLDPVDWGAGVPAWMLARGVSTLGNPDMLGGYLVFPLILSAAVTISEERAGWRVAGWAAFSLIAVAWLSTLTRGAWLGGALGLSLLAMAAVRTKVALRRVDFAAMTCAALALAGTAWVHAGRLLPRLAAMLSPASEDASVRFTIWRSGLAAIREHWLFGVGPDSFRYAYLPVRSAEHALLGGSNMSADDAHNYLIMLAATLGVPALLVALAFLASLLSKAGRSLFDTPGGQGRIVYAGWLAAVVAHCGYLFFGPGSLGSAALLWLAFGVLLAPMARPADAWSDRRRVAVGSGVAGVTLVCLALVAPLLLSDAYLLRSRLTPMPQALQWAERAQRTMPWVLDNRFAVAELTGSQALAYASTAPSAEARAAAERAVSAYDELLAFAPVEYEVRVVYADVLNGLAPVLGPSAAERALELALSAQPLFPAGMHWRAQAASALIAQERFDAAVEMLEGVWDSDPYYAEPGIRYAWALREAGRTDEADAVVRDLERTYPDDERVAQFVAFFRQRGAQ